MSVSGTVRALGRVPAPPAAASATLTAVPSAGPAAGATLTAVKDPHVAASNGKIQTYFGNSQGLQSVDALIDREGNRAKMEKAFEALEQRFKNEGKNLKTVWPRSLKIDWIDEQGNAGCTYLDSTDPEIQALRDVYRSDRDEGKNGKEGKLRYDVASWPSRPPGVRGDMNGPKPLVKESERLQKLGPHLTEQHKINALEGKKTPDQKRELLRKVEIGSKLVDSFREVIGALEEEEKKKTPPAEPEKREAAQALIDQLGRLKNHPIDQWGIEWALAHPIPTGDLPRIKSEYQENVAALKAAIRQEKGPISTPSYNWTLIPGAFTVAQMVNDLAKRTDDALTPAEETYAEDVAALNIHHFDLNVERSHYRNVVAKQKQDSLEQLLVKLAGAIDRGEATGRCIEEILGHPVLSGLLAPLPPQLQTRVRQGMEEKIQQLTRFANNLKPTAPVGAAPGAAPAPAPAAAAPAPGTPAATLAEVAQRAYLEKFQTEAAAQWAALQLPSTAAVPP